LREIELNDTIRVLFDGILSQACHSIMGISIRNLATLGGSIMGKLSFSDLYPALLVMNAKLVFYKAGEKTFLDFINGPRMDKDILTKIVIKKESGTGFFKKVAITPLDFAIINFAVVKSSKGYAISTGATPYTAILANKTSEYLNSCKEIDENVIDKAIEIALKEIKVSDNVRSSKEYRTELIRTYIRRAIRQVTKNVN